MSRLQSIRRALSRADEVTAIIVAFAVCIGVFVFLPLSLPAIAASNARAISWITFAVSGLCYLTIWIVAAFSMMDCAAYVYGFDRPFLAGRPSRRFFTLGKPRIAGRRSFVFSSVLSYALTLYGFAIAYCFIANLDSSAFKTDYPMSFGSCVYFAVSTAATVGFGDIAPLSSAARTICTLEMLFSTLYLVLIFSTIAGFAHGSRKTDSN